MSWTCSIPEVPTTELHDAIDAAIPTPAEIGGAVLAQFEAAKAMAHALHETGVVGQGQLPVTVRLSGHSSADPSKESQVTVQIIELAPTIAQALPDPPPQDLAVHDEDGEPLSIEEIAAPRNGATAESSVEQVSDDDEAADAAEGE
jgi:hypothetical protein